VALHRVGGEIIEEFIFLDFRFWKFEYDWARPGARTLFRQWATPKTIDLRRSPVQP
jgi:hypothetical protein